MRRGSSWAGTRPGAGSGAPAHAPASADALQPAGTQAGDKLVEVSASFGADVWQAQNFGQVMYAIKTRNGQVGGQEEEGWSGRRRARALCPSPHPALNPHQPRPATAPGLPQIPAHVRRHVGIRDGGGEQRPGWRGGSGSGRRAQDTCPPPLAHAAHQVAGLAVSRLPHFLPPLPPPPAHPPSKNPSTRTSPSSPIPSAVSKRSAAAGTTGPGPRRFRPSGTPSARRRKRSGSPCSRALSRSLGRRTLRPR